MKTAPLLVVVIVFSATAHGQTQTTGGISGTVTDQNGDAVANASIKATSRATGDKRSALTDSAGRFTVSLIQPGRYQVQVDAAGFAATDVDVDVTLADVSEIEIQLTVADVLVDPVTVDGGTPLIRTDSSTVGQTIGQTALENLPLPTRNFTQLIAVVPGASTYLTNVTNLGHNSYAITVNGIRPTQNNFQINGVDVNAGVMRDIQFGTPAPESVAELKVQTSNYDATFGRAGGGSVQVVTKSGANDLNGGIYYYFSDTSFNANDPFLKAAGVPRPLLVRNVYGGTLGGPLRKDRVFFFASYQGSRERNGFSPYSLRTNVFIDERLTDDRSNATLMTRFGLKAIEPVAYKLLNARLPDGRFVVPTPGQGGLYSTSEISRSREEQFNANADVRLSEKNWLAAKFFFASSPQFLAFVGTSLPGFGNDQKRYYGILSVQDVHTFSADIVNEARFGYNYIREDAVAQQPISEEAIGITRSNSIDHPGFPFIVVGGGMTIGPGQREDQATLPSWSITDTLSIRRGRHNLRIGGDARFYRYAISTTTMTRGSVTIENFDKFLTGTVQRAQLANGILERDMRATDYHFFLQDDWKFSRKLTFNLGLRYELDLPIYDTEGRISTFDPLLYRPRMESNNNMPLGPPLGGLVQAGNAVGRFDRPDIPNVADHGLYGIDVNNFAPRVGLAYSPFSSDSVTLRVAYGIFYSRPSFQYIVLGSFQPPFYSVGILQEGQFADPFPSVPSTSEFPALIRGPLLFGSVFDRGMRTPYSQQWNGSLQVALSKDTTLELGYVGTRGINLFRQFALNQAYLMGPGNPIRNPVTGLEVTSNTPANAQLRAPYQGAFVSAQFNSNQTAAQSTYHSAQLSLNRRFSRDLHLLASYTYSKSIDTASGVGGGAVVGGTLNPDFINDTSFPDGDQRNGRSSRGVSDFDRTQRLVISYVWEVPRIKKAPKPARKLFAGWQFSGILTAMSGLPINIRDSRGAELFFGPNGGGDRPSWAPGQTAQTAMTNVLPGYYFNPMAFRRAVVVAGQQIPSSTYTALAGPGCPIIGNGICTDFGNLGRNPLRGPRQFGFDAALAKQFRISEKMNLQLRIEAFNVLNTVNFANPASNFNFTINGGIIDNTTGTITEPGQFGRITSTSTNPRIMQVAIKINF